MAKYGAAVSVVQLILCSSVPQKPTSLCLDQHPWCVSVISDTSDFTGVTELIAVVRRSNCCIFPMSFIARAGGDTVRPLYGPACMGHCLSPSYSMPESRSVLVQCSRFSRKRKIFTENSRREPTGLLRLFMDYSF